MNKYRANTLILVLLGLTLIVLISQSPHVKAQPKTITVPDDYPTIQEAVGNASADDTVFIRKGVYLEDSYNGVVIEKIHLADRGDQQTIIRPRYYFYYYYQSRLSLSLY